MLDNVFNYDCRVLRMQMLSVDPCSPRPQPRLHLVIVLCLFIVSAKVFIFSVSISRGSSRSKHSSDFASRGSRHGPWCLGASCDMQLHHLVKVSYYVQPQLHVSCRHAACQSTGNTLTLACSSCVHCALCCQPVRLECGCVCADVPCAPPTHPPLVRIPH